MPRQKHTPEQIIAKLRQAEVAMSTSSTVVEAVRQIEVTEQTFYRWRNEFGTLRAIRQTTGRQPGDHGLFGCR
jgi:putative transposase